MKKGSESSAESLISSNEHINIDCSLDVKADVSCISAQSHSV